MSISLFIFIVLYISLIITIIPFYYIENPKVCLYHIVFLLPSVIIIGTIEFIRNTNFHKFMMQNPTDVIKFRIKLEKK